MEKKHTLTPVWSAKFVEDNVVLAQKAKTLTIPTEELSSMMLESIKSKHICGGCIDLPVHGYHSSKCSWCSFSRGIASFYENGRRWVDDEPPKQYLLITSEISLMDPTVRFDQSFTIFKGKSRGLKKKIKKLKQSIVDEACRHWTPCSPEPEFENAPYYVGYVHAVFRTEDGSLDPDVKHSLGQTKTIIGPIADGDLVMIDADLKAYTLTVKELVNGETSFSLYRW